MIPEGKQFFEHSSYDIDWNRAENFSNCLVKNFGNAFVENEIKYEYESSTRNGVIIIVYYK